MYNYSRSYNIEMYSLHVFIYIFTKILVMSCCMMYFAFDIEINAAVDRCNWLLRALSHFFCARFLINFFATLVYLFRVIAVIAGKIVMHGHVPIAMLVKNRIRSIVSIFQFYFVLFKASSSLKMDQFRFWSWDLINYLTWLLQPLYLLLNL